MANVLELWLHEKVRQEWQQSDGYRTGKKTPERITRADIDSYHVFKLRETLAYACQKSSFYKELFDKHGITPETIQSIEDLAKLPFTTQDILRESPYRLLCISLGELERAMTFVSSGTTGSPKKAFFAQSDLDKMVDFMEAGMRTVTTAKDVVQILLPGGSPLGQLDLLSAGVEKIGASVVRAGTTPTPEQQLELIKQHKSTILFGQTSRIYRITQELLAKGYDLSNTGVKTLFVTSVYLPEAMRQRLKKVWNCEVSAHYGLTEMGLGVAVECQEHSGFHLNEVDLLLEIVDPETGKVIKDGTEGELVFTALGREAMPLIRYRTHDISRWIIAPCSCGATTLLKFARVNRRLESIVRIGEGDEIYPALFDEILFTFPQVYEYKVAIERKDGKDQLNFTVEFTSLDERLQTEISKALLKCPVIRKNIDNGRMLPPAIELVPMGSLDHSGRPKKLVVDRRNI